VQKNNRLNGLILAAGGGILLSQIGQEAVPVFVRSANEREAI
jgi:hypothetical protein